MRTINLKKFDLETKQGKLFKALVLDKEVLTKAAITKHFGIKNPSATVADIRARGYVIYQNSRKADNGVAVTEYKHGDASRKMVALYYAARSAGIVA